MPTRRSILIHAMEKSAMRTFWCRNSCLASKRVIGPVQAAQIAASPECPWAATAHCISRFVIHNFFPQSAHTARQSLTSFRLSPRRLRQAAGVHACSAQPSVRRPIPLARSANLAGLKIYFDCGDQDDFVFESGATALDKLLDSRHIPHEAHIYPGRHDWQYFAEHLPASLEFHSRLFHR